jgi:hypothetical protein
MAALLQASSVTGRSPHFFGTSRSIWSGNEFWDELALLNLHHVWLCKRCENLTLPAVLSSVNLLITRCRSALVDGALRAIDREKSFLKSSSKAKSREAECMKNVCAFSTGTCNASTLSASDWGS